MIVNGLCEMFMPCGECKSAQYCATVLKHCPLVIALAQQAARSVEVEVTRTPASEGEQK